jgi:hypothetical protein
MNRPLFVVAQWLSAVTTVALTRHVGVGIFLILLGLAVIVVAVVALVRGHLDWARIGSRKISGGVLIGGFVLLIIGSILSEPGTPTATPTAASGSLTTSTSSAVPTTTTTVPPTTVPTTTTTVPPTTTHVVTTTHTAPPPHTVHTTKAAPPPVVLACSAGVDNPHPSHNETVEIVVHTTAGAGVTVTAHYKSKDTTHEKSASGSTVDVPFDISTATYGYPVTVDVTVSEHGASKECATSFTPEA